MTLAELWHLLGITLGYLRGQSETCLSGVERRFLATIEFAFTYGVHDLNAGNDTACTPE